ncbi:hypothetical protein BC835DRAFT_256585 [Cytidiella melzeri]|nr:hypothetical protein BC835DRAFT_256585 [Cytidiella melzeri]
MWPRHQLQLSPLLRPQPPPLLQEQHPPQLRPPVTSNHPLDPSVICSNFAQDGQSPPVTGQVASLTSTNNFINFCSGKTLTNGLQVVAGSCNPAPMGDIPANTKMTSAKFQTPVNFQTFKENTPFTISLAVSNLQLGNFVNANENYFAGPQQLSGGTILGHSHVVVEAIDSFTSTKVSNPQVFAFFKGLNDAGTNGVVSADVTAGLPAGIYKVSSINTAANHQPVLMPVAQHGSTDDVVYFAVTADGAPPAEVASLAGAATATAAASAATAAAATATAAASSVAAITSSAAAKSSSAAAAAATAASGAAAAGSNKLGGFKGGKVGKRRAVF